MTAGRLVVAAIGGADDADRAAAALDRVRGTRPGEFAGVDLRPAATLDDAVDGAIAAGAEWLFALAPGEAPASDALPSTAPLLRIHDAVFGGAGLHRPDGREIPLVRESRLVADNLPMFFHAALAWWIGTSHLVRPALARDALLQAGTDDATRSMRYRLALFESGQAAKTAGALSVVHGEALPPVSPEERAYLVERLRAAPVFFTVEAGGRRIEFPYTGLNPTIEREHTRGRFFEHEELGCLRSMLPAGGRIVDVGANTGNHAAFFAAVMGAREVVVLEPDPQAARILRLAVARNGLTDRIDTSLLGIGIGAAEGQMALRHSRSGGLGATRLVADTDGSVPVRPLDAVIDGPVDLLKIDVEGMELDVLAGAEETIRRSRPFIFVEATDANAIPMLRWIDAHDYAIDRLFPDKEHCNYLLRPRERRVTEAGGMA